MLHYIIVGVQRSGNHAIINWIRKQFKFRVLFDNNLDPEAFANSRFRSFPSMPIRYSWWNTSMCSFENLNRSQIINLKKSKYYYKKTKTIIVLRDCYNLMASYLKFINLHNIENIIGCWIDNANMVLNNECECVLFNKWFVDADYRKELCLKFKMPFTDGGLNEVLTYGAGSSFDGLKYNGKAQNMDVFNRWLVYKNKPEYINLFTQEMHDLNEKIFGFNLKDKLLGES